VSAYFEHLKFHRDPARFVSDYQRRLNVFEERLASMENPQAVQLIQFEEFVVSEDCRQALCARLGLDSRDQQPGRWFRPEQSARNTRNFENFPDQDIIKQLETELTPYIWRGHREQSA